MQTLIARDVFIRKPMVPVLDRCIRVSVGPDDELDIFAEELPRALAAARGAEDHFSPGLAEAPLASDRAAKGQPRP